MGELQTENNFINKISEKRTLWEHLFYLQKSKPIVLYGMGNGAEKILDLCAERNIKISDVFASDEFVRGHFFRGCKVKKLAEIESLYKDFCILTSFATNIPEVIEKIYKLNGKYELYAPNFPVFGGDYPDYDFFRRNTAALEKTYNMLCDGMSKEIYINTINFALSGKLEYLKNTESAKHDALDLLDLRGNLHYTDVGAYTGDTISELKDYLDGKNISIKKISAFEPDKKNFAKLEINLNERNLINLCEIYNLGAWSGEKVLYFDSKSGRNSNFDNNAANSKKSKEVCVNALDNILQIESNANLLLKYDVEGAEYEALTGTKEIIKKYSPQLIVSLYHRREDIFKLPILIQSINPDYKFYIRRHRYIPCWDLNLYAAHFT